MEDQRFQPISHMQVYDSIDSYDLSKNIYANRLSTNHLFLSLGFKDGELLNIS